MSDASSPWEFYTPENEEGPSDLAIILVLSIILLIGAITLTAQVIVRDYTVWMWANAAFIGIVGYGLIERLSHLLSK